MNGNFPVKNSPEIPVEGAFELYEGAREELITLTRTGQLLTVGDTVPAIPGIETDGKPYILHTVNALGTETCDGCVSELESFHINNPEIPVFSLTKQENPEAIITTSADTVTHPRVTIDQERAIDLGVALLPGENAEPEFWPTALRRTLAVIDGDGTILRIEQPDDQEQALDFMAAYETVLAASE